MSKGDNSRQQMIGQMDAQAPLSALCTSSDGHLSMYHLIPFYTFRDMLQTSFFNAKIKKESNSVNTGDSVMVLAFCNFLHGPLSVYQVSFIYLQYF